jgi:hypothetical protein
VIDNHLDILDLILWFGILVLVILTALVLRVPEPKPSLAWAYKVPYTIPVPYEKPQWKPSRNY